MQVASVMVALSGDKGQTVPKMGVTPSEIAVLRIIHGEESITDIQPYGQIDRSSRAERQRLIERYGKMEDGEFLCRAVNSLFPGVAARLYETFDELELPEEFFKPVYRVSDAGIDPAERRARELGTESPTLEEVVQPLDAPVKKSRKKAVEAAPLPVIEEAPADAASSEDDDGIGDMDPVGDDMFK